MLTDDDLRKIGEVFDQRLEVKLEEKLETKLEEKLETKLEEKLEAKLDQKLDSKLESKFEEKLAPIRYDIGSLQKDVESLKKGSRRIRRDLSMVLKYLDGERAAHDRRITRIEDHLSLPPLE
jgi:hypothetical protein